MTARTKAETGGILPSGGVPRSGIRWFVLFLISLMYLITYMDRANISVTAPAMASEFGMSKIEMGFVFSAFAWAYAAGQIPGGWLADRFGPKKVLLTIVSFWSFMTAATAWAIGTVSLLTVRFLFGLGEAGAFPTATRAMQLWFPREERGIIQGVTHCFSRLAVALTPFIAVAIMTAFGWRWVFYAFAVLGLVWAIAFAVALPQPAAGTSRRQRSRVGAYPRRAGKRRHSFHRQAKRALEADLLLAQHVVHRRGLFLFFLRLVFLCQLVSHLPVGISPPVAQGGRLCGPACR